MFPFLVLAGGALCLAALKRVSLARTLPISVLAAALGTYLCTAVGLKSTALPLAVLLLVGLCAAVWQRGCMPQLKAALCSPAAAAFLLAVVAALLGARHMRLVNFDDVAHWALFTRQQCGLEHFPSAVQSASEFADYPPGIQMFSVFLQLFAPFRHSLLFTGHFLWVAALLLPLLEELRWSPQWWKNLVAPIGGGFFLLAFPALFTKYYTENLVVEPIMGLLLGYLVYIAWENPQPGGLELLGVSLALSVLMIAKSTGPMYAAFGAIAVLLLWAKPLWAMLRRRGGALACFAAAAAPLLFYGSWQWLCRINQTSSYFTQDIPAAYSLQNFKAFMTLENGADSVVKHFLQMFCLAPLNQAFGPSALGVLLVVWALALVLCRLEPAVKGRILTALGAMSLLFLAYMVMLCYSYLYLFQDWEAEELSAFHRYVMPLPMALSVLVLGALEPQLRRLCRSGWRWLGAAALAVSLLALNWGAVGRLTPAGYLAMNTGGKQTWYLEFGEYQEQTAALAPLVGKEGNRVLILTQKPSWDHSSRLYKYFFTPAVTLALNPQEYEGSAQLIQDFLTNEEYNYLWCTPDCGALPQEWNLRDGQGSALQPGALYAARSAEGYILEKVALPQ